MPFTLQSMGGLSAGQDGYYGKTSSFIGVEGFKNV